MPNLIGRSKKDLMYILWKYYPGKHKINGSGYVINQNPSAFEKIGPPYKFSILLDSL